MIWTDKWLATNADQHSLSILLSHKFSHRMFWTYPPSYRSYTQHLTSPFSRSFADEQKNDRRLRPILSAHVISCIYAERCLRHKFVFIARILNLYVLRRSSCIKRCSVDGYEESYVAKTELIVSQFSLFRRSRRPSHKVNCILNF